MAFGGTIRAIRLDHHSSNLERDEMSEYLNKLQSGHAKGNDEIAKQPPPPAIPLPPGVEPTTPGPSTWGPKRTAGNPLLCPIIGKDPLKPIGSAVPGMDISHYQPKINWGSVLEAGFKFCMIKATDGTGSKSSTYDNQRLMAHQNGLIVGAYHFARFGGLKPRDEADHFLKITGGVRVGELPLTIDCEWDRFNPKYSSGKIMDEAAAAEILELLERVEAATKMTPFLYCSYPFFKGFEKPERFFRFHPWCPAYWRSGTNEITGPKVPLPWSRVAIWQWTDNHPTAKGITGDKNLDGNWFNGTIQQLGAMTRQA